jgi:hypothetical protein
MRAHILDIIQYKTTTGPAPMIHNLEEDVDYEWPSENGEMELFRIEVVSGVKKFVRSGKGKGQGKGGEDILCYRCGDLGHISPNCKATKHKLGGPPREKPPPKGRRIQRRPLRRKQKGSKIKRPCAPSSSTSTSTLSTPTK